MPDINIPVDGGSAAATALIPTIAIANNSALLIDAAICFVRESLRVQQKYDENVQSDVKLAQNSNYRAYVMGAVFTSVAFLDAAINEVFLDAVKCLPKKYRKDAFMKNGKRKKFANNLTIPNSQVSSYRKDTLSPTVVKDMAQLWLRQQEYKSWVKQNPKFKTYLSKNSHGSNVSRWLPAWDKYQLALFLNQKIPISERNPKRSNVQTLIDFRNELIHFKPGVSVSTPQDGTLKPVEYER